MHRYPGPSIPADLITVRNRLPVAVPEIALLDAWRILPRLQRRAPIIDACRIGITGPGALAEHLQTRPKIVGRAELRQLLELLAGGCQSELEIMGFTRVFSDERLPPARRQFVVTVDGSRFILDVAWPELFLAVELDGATHHGGEHAREYDVRRDAALARAGWLTIRLTYNRLVEDPTSVIDELLQIIATRRRQFGDVA